MSSRLIPMLMLPLLMLMLMLLVPVVRGQMGTVSDHYDGFKVVRVDPKGPEGLKMLKKLYDFYDKSLFWDRPSRADRPIELLVHPLKMDAVKTLLPRVSLETVVDDYQRYLDGERSRITSRKAYDPDDFNTFEDIMTELDRMSTACVTGFICDITNVGQSIEGEDIKMLRIYKSDGGQRQVLWLDSLMHAREWLAGATTMNIVSKLMSEYGSGEEATHVLDNYDVYLVPVANPDGYKYTISDVRLWRKNRRPSGVCYGVDLNRNFAARWGTGGSSSSPCSDTYMGESAASEPETQAYQTAISEIGDRVVALYTVHTFGQYMLIPYGAPSSSGGCLSTPDDDDLMDVAKTGCDKIEEIGQTGRWMAGSPCEILYPASGGSFDYVYETAGVKYCFGPELRGGSFAPPRGEIGSSVSEMFAGIYAMIRRIEAIEG